MVALFDSDSWFENQLRFLAIEVMRDAGCAKALEIVERARRMTHFIATIGDANINRICKGIRTELQFYKLFAKKYSLIPTLDAGCQFDYVGIKAGSPLCIDVTARIASKMGRSNRCSYGVFSWPLKFAELTEGEVKWYDSLPTNQLEIVNVENAPPCVEINVDELNVGRIKNHLAEFKIRHQLFRNLVSGKRLNAVLGDLNKSQSINAVFKYNLEQQLRFFTTYRWALNLLPMLSGGSMIDFVGQHGTELNCYHVHTGKIKQSEAFEPMCKNAYKFIPWVARYSDDEWRFDDPEELTIFLPSQR